MKYSILTISIILKTIVCQGQLAFEGIVTDSETNEPIKGVIINLVENSKKTKSKKSGEFAIKVDENSEKTLTFELEGYMFEEYRNVKPGEKIEIKLRKRKKSLASLRWDEYMLDTNAYKGVEIPDNPEWNLNFTETNLKGDLRVDPNFTRRDPSAVIKVDGKYFVWYTYTPSSRSSYHKEGREDWDKVFPWDRCDIYYATSEDGYTWKEHGAAVERGPEGAYDDRSVFTPEILAHKGKYYLVYQVIQGDYKERAKNNVAMAVAESPHGPWKKLPEPILRPTNNGIWSKGSTSRLDADKKGDFDSHKVHDPCLLFYKDKFYLYYKGERMGEEKFCGEREIKWGVAIADNPEGPYVKSEYNPITNTGHEVCVWPFENGIAIIQKLDGPEMGTVQFAEDGVNFKIMGKANNVPDALGLYRDESPEVHQHAEISWGLAHVLKWNILNGGWMHLSRFEIKGAPITSIDIKENSVDIQKNKQYAIEAIISPSFAENKRLFWSSNNNSVATVNKDGVIDAIALGSATIMVSNENNTITDEVGVNVISEPGNKGPIEVDVKNYVHHNGIIPNLPNNEKGIGWYESGKFVDYKVFAAEKGVYQLKYYFNNRQDNSSVTYSVGGLEISSDEVSSFSTEPIQQLIAANNASLNMGVNTIRIRVNSKQKQAQFELYNIVLTKIKDLTDIPVMSLDIVQKDEVITTKGSTRLDVEILPFNATNKSITWSSNDQSVAKVTENGVVLGVNSGIATITASTEDGKISQKVIIEVKQHIEPYIEIINRDEILNKVFKQTDSINIKCRYHVGIGDKVNAAHGGIKYMIREMKGDWSKVVNDYNFWDLSTIYTESGKSDFSIPLNGVKPSSELKEGRFYFIYAIMKTEKGKILNYSIDYIIVE